MISEQTRLVADEVRQLYGGADLLTEADLRAIDAIVAAAPPLSERMRMRIGRLLSDFDEDTGEGES